MCLFPRLIKNRKYLPNKKNGGKPPPVYDERLKWVSVGCQNCMECRKKKAREWQVRLMEDIKHNRHAKFITLTFSNESIKKILCENKYLNLLEGYQLDNEIATRATRLFLERWRKKHKKSLRHWLVSELGGNGTENIHLHGIIWTKETYEEIHNHWQYGYIWPRPKTNVKTYVTGRTISYMVKYISKQDTKHKHYKSIILSSAGIGANYLNTIQHKLNKFNETKTDERYRLENGTKLPLPIYLRNKIYTEQEREKLWLQKLDENVLYIGGEKVKADDHDTIHKLREYYRKINKKLGHGDDTKNWDEEQYEIARRNILYERRTK